MGDLKRVDSCRAYVEYESLDQLDFLPLRFNVPIRCSFKFGVASTLSNQRRRRSIKYATALERCIKKQSIDMHVNLESSKTIAYLSRCCMLGCMRSD
jgi:hypothetical protein